ncbi:hypothetical protein, partial [Paenibacillus pinihumi]|uniref:hypothetical protein n=1 Tax=Paenibacillus pinihumi TaxID=669462 RepID=UPI00048BB44A
MNLKPMYAAVPLSPSTELTAAINDTVTTIPLLTVNNKIIPDAPNIVTIGTDSNAETIYYTGKSGNSLTGVTRGFDGTTAKSWPATSKISRFAAAHDLNTLKENVEALGAHATESATLQAHLTRGVNKIETDQPSLFDGTVYGRTLVNWEPEGNFEKDSNNDGVADGWISTFGSGGPGIPSRTKGKFGDWAQKLIFSTSSNPRIYKNLNLDSSKRYLVTAWIKAKGNSTRFRVGNGSHTADTTFANLAVSAAEDFVFYNVLLPANTPKINITLMMQDAGSAETDEFTIDGVFVIDIGSSEVSEIPLLSKNELEMRYGNYIDGMQSVRGALIEHPGRNLVPPATNVITQASSSTVIALGTNLIELTTTAAHANAFIVVPVIPNQQYAVSVNLEGGTDFAIYTDSNTPSSIVGYGTTPKTFNSGNNNAVRFYIRNIAASTRRFSDMMIVLGGLEKLPPSFVPREDQRIIIDEVLRSLPNGIRDQVGILDRTVTRFVKSIPLDASYTWAFDTSYTGYKRIRVANGNFGGVNDTHIAARFDGKPIPYTSVWDSADQIRLINDYIYLTVDNAVSGWIDSINPSGNAVKALLNGWRASTNNGSTYTGWVSILDGSAPPVGTGPETYVIANKAPGWTSYGTLQYQLAKPVTDPARIEGAISL